MSPFNPVRHCLSLAFVVAGLIAWPAASWGQAPPPGSPPAQRVAAQPTGVPTGPPQQGVAPQQQPVGQPASQGTPLAPFQLAPDELAQLDLVLRQWEVRSDAIRTLDVKFTRLEFDDVFETKKESTGELKFEAPDKGLYRIEGEAGEHWVCDGLSVFEYDHTSRKIIERKLPPELQGKAITDGPLPFLFGAKADKLKARYWMRISPAPNAQEKQRREDAGEIWLEAYPKHQQDAANFQKSQLILRQADMLPSAIQVFLPNGTNRTVHIFSTAPSVNDNELWRRIKNGGDPFKVRPPLGWELVQAPAEPPPVQEQFAPTPQQALQPNGAPENQARRLPIGLPGKRQ